MFTVTGLQQTGSANKRLEIGRARVLYENTCGFHSAEILTLLLGRECGKVDLAVALVLPPFGENRRSSDPEGRFEL